MTLTHPDDQLEQIDGIGPVVARQLRKNGITTVEELAGKELLEVVQLVAGIRGMTESRIAGEDWLGQARALAREEEAAGSGGGLDGQEYRVLKVELLLDPQKEVRRTTVSALADPDNYAQWAGWNLERLGATLLEIAGIPPVAGEPSAPEPEPKEVEEDHLIRSASLSTESLAPTRAEHIFHRDEQFRIHLHIDLAEKQFAAPVQHVTRLYVRNLDSERRIFLRELQGEAGAPGPLDIHLNARLQDAGVYRLEGDMKMMSRDQAQPVTTRYGGDLFLVI